MGGNEKFLTNCSKKTLGGRDRSEGCNIEMDPEGIDFEDVDWFPRAKVRNLRRAFYERGNEPSFFHKISFILLKS
jgi:hypothetical protein